MSIFNFMIEAGEKVVNTAEGLKDDAVKKALDAFNLGTKDVNVAVDGDKVILKGEVKDQSVFEKAILAVGNAVGVATVDAANLKVSSGTAGTSVFYTVKKGDSLWKIAEAQYGKGNGDKNSLIFEANKPMLTSPDKIYPGQTLRIPPLK